jgi:hypothetical protein
MATECPEILILKQLRKIIPSLEKSSKKAFKSLSTLTIAISPDHLSPSPSAFSAMKTPGPSESLVKTEETPENRRAPL